MRKSETGRGEGREGEGVGKEGGGGEEREREGGVPAENTVVASMRVALSKSITRYWYSCTWGKGRERVEEEDGVDGVGCERGG